IPPPPLPPVAAVLDVAVPVAFAGFASEHAASVAAARSNGAKKPNRRLIRNLRARRSATGVPHELPEKSHCSRRVRRPTVCQRESCRRSGSSPAAPLFADVFVNSSFGGRWRARLRRDLSSTPGQREIRLLIDALLECLAHHDIAGDASAVVFI